MVIHNTVKFSRLFRNKNEALHAAVKRKYQGCFKYNQDCVPYVCTVYYICVLNNGVHKSQDNRN